MLKVYIGRVSLLCPELNQELLDLLPEDRRIRVCSMKNEQERCRSAAAGLLLQRALGDIGIDMRTQIISRGEHGKPMLKDVPLYFNLSHAGDCVICALSDVSVGADVEQLSKFKKREQRERLMKRILTEEEMRLWEQDKTAEHALRFWTRKESYVKRTGTGLSCDFRSVDTLHHVCYVERMLDREYHFSICTEVEISAEFIQV